MRRIALLWAGLLFVVNIFAVSAAGQSIRIRGVSLQHGLDELDVVRWDAEAAELFHSMGDATRHIAIGALNILDFDDEHSWQEFPTFKSVQMLSLRNATRLKLGELLPRSEYSNSLTRITLMNAEVLSSDLAAIARTKCLKYCIFFECDVGTADFRELAESRTLVSLSIHFSTVSDEQIFAISNVRSLTSLDLESEDMTEGSLFALGRLSRLRRLSVRNDALDEAVFQRFREANPSVQLTRLSKPR